MDTGSVPNILIVDDNPNNLEVLAGMLKKRGYETRPIPSGKLALRAASSEVPDLILLDINMPEMDGYEVCRRLKQDEALRGVPVIFISALSGTLDKVKAFGSGGVDYITKPFHFDEVEARVRTHLSLHQLRQDLEQRYQELRELEALRDGLTHMIVHDLSSPLAAIMGHLELLEMNADQLSDDRKTDLEVALRCTHLLNRMIRSLLDVNRMESGEMPLRLKDCDLAANLEEALSSLGGSTQNHRISIDLPSETVVVNCDPELTRRVIANLVGNAIKFTPVKGEVRVAIVPSGERVRVSVEDSGPGIPEEYHEKIFEKFGQVEARRQRRFFSTGLGLAFCKLAVEAHGGVIGVDSVVGEGSTLWFELPMKTV